MDYALKKKYKPGKTSILDKILTEQIYKLIGQQIQLILNHSRDQIVHQVD